MTPFGIPQRRKVMIFDARDYVVVKREALSSCSEATIAPKTSRTTRNLGELAGAQEPLLLTIEFSQ
jgi:hypothetical protein